MPTTPTTTNNAGAGEVTDAATLRQRCASMSRRALTATYNLGALVFVSVVLALAAEECDDDQPVTDPDPPQDQTTPDPPQDQTTPDPPQDQTTPDPPQDQTTPDPPQDQTTPDPPQDEVVWQAPTTTAGPGSTGGDSNGGAPCEPGTSWACDEVNSGIEDGYLPEDFNPHQPANTDDLMEIIEDYSTHNPDFDGDAALAALEGAQDETQRGDMFNAIAAGLGIGHNPEDPFEVADELADMDILYGHDMDGDGVVNPYDRPDADADSVMSNAQLAALLDRIQDLGDGPDETGNGPDETGDGPDETGNGPDETGNGPSGPTVQDPFNPGPGPTGPTGAGPGPTGAGPNGPGPVDPGPTGAGPTGAGPTGAGPADPDVCALGVAVAMTENQREAFASELWWETLVAIGPRGEPGELWPPHPGVPGGASWLVVSMSPVWPVVEPALATSPWEVVDHNDGCWWIATEVETRLQQLLPWRPSERRMVQVADAARPDAGLGAYLRRWDNLRPDQQAEVIASQPNHDFTANCALATAAVSADSRQRCSWALEVPGVWSWQAWACFEADAGDARFRDCATLAGGVEWFLGLADYTQHITLSAARAPLAGLGLYG